MSGQICSLVYLFFYQIVYDLNYNLPIFYIIHSYPLNASGMDLNSYLKLKQRGVNATKKH